MGFVKRRSLSFKVIIVASLILVAAISSGTWLNIRLHEKHIKKLTLEKTKIVSESIERNVVRAMERGRHYEVNQILKSFMDGDVWKINIFSPDGVIMVSTQVAELNRRVNDLDLFLKNEYFVREERLFDEQGKKKRERIYYFSSPIMNRPECYQCHSQEEKVIGILSIAHSLREMDEEIVTSKLDSLILAVITIGFLCLVMSVLFLRFVNAPINELTKTMKRVEKGDLSARARLESRDEMGRLAEELNGMIGKLNDAKREAEEYHRELVHRADRMASIGELASGIAHEIRNPLAGIQGAIQILSDGFDRGDERRGIANEIQKQIYKLERLVKNMLNYAKPVPANYFPMDINELADKVINFFVTQQGRLDYLKIEKKFSSSLPKVMVDPSSMEQAFLNIVLNAQKAMPHGGTLSVSTLSRDGREVQIIFEDTGVGISTQNLPKIFNPFFSTRADGTGLGLSITKNIVEQHEGRIEVESRVNEGTKFTIAVPAVKTE